jgi:hypothetical protein
MLRIVPSVHLSGRTMVLRLALGSSECQRNRGKQEDMTSELHPVALL